MCRYHLTLSVCPPLFCIRRLRGNTIRVASFRPTCTIFGYTLVVMMLRLFGTIIFSARIALGVTCYDLNRNPASNLLPCDTTADGVTSHSTCCNHGDVCLASGMCLSTQDSLIGRLFWINGCTDKSFKSDRCFPQLCRDQIGVGFQLTNLIACDADHWCCTGNGENCCNGTNTVVLDQGVGTAVRQLPFVTDATSSSSSSSLSSTSSSSTSSTSTTSSITSAPALSTSSSCEQPGPNIEASPIGLITGLAVVGAALVVALMAIWFLVVRLRRLKSEAGSSASAPGPAPTPSTQYAIPYHGNGHTQASSGSQMGDIPQGKAPEYYQPRQAPHELYGYVNSRELNG
ncbi:hypothetical protein F4810DRAFT_681934 [Camillea tinctor]|nr:hypothetical protein F4810DRAFT_681934 [Camillea tinctor]